MVRLTFLCSALLCAVAMNGQETATPNASKVDLYVVAADKSGKPVAGLQQQDFTLTDNKQPQQITAFKAVGQASGDDVQIVLVLDAVNTDFSRVAFVRQQMDNFLKQDGGRLARPVSIAIFTDSGMQIQPSASTDGNALAAYLDKNETGLRTSNRSQGIYGAAQRTQMSIDGLAELAAYEQKRPGRKLVVWISPGWALLSGPRMELSNKQEQEIFSSAVRMSTAIEQAGMTLYMVNPLGTSENLTQTFYYQQFLKPLTKPNQAMYGNLSLQVFAVHSGGDVLMANNDVAGLIEKCVRDANAYYILSFNPPGADGPNFYNSIEVKVKGGLKAQTVSGFYEQPGR